MFGLSQDWNTFLLRFNELDFCVSENETIKHGLNESTTPESMVVTSGQARSSTQVPLLLEDSGPINISVPITLTLDPQRPFGGYSRNITHLYATVLGQQVGLSGRFCSSSSFKMFNFSAIVLSYKPVRSEHIIININQSKEQLGLLQFLAATDCECCTPAVRDS